MKVLFLILLTEFSFANPGFLSLPKSGVPSQVKEQGSKVLEIWGPGAIKPVISTELDRIEPQVVSLTKQNENFRMKMAAHVVLAEINFCRVHQLKVCHLSEQPARGSAVIVNGNQLVTVAHNFTSSQMGVENRLQVLKEKWEVMLKNPQERLKALSEIEKFKRNPLTETIFLLTDEAGKIVFDSTKQLNRFDKLTGTYPTGVVDLTSCQLNGAGQNCTLSVSLNQGAKNKNTASFMSEDHAVVTLAGTHPSIPISKEPCKVGQKSYNVGYPSATEGREAAGARNAEDRELSVTQGQLLGNNEVRLRGRGWSQINHFVDGMSAQADRPLFSSSDSSPGMSGGAILNEEGQLCGIIAGNLPAKDDLMERDNASGAWLRFSYGPNVHDILAPVMADSLGRGTSQRAAR